MTAAVSVSRYLVDLVMLAQYVAGFEMTLSEKQLLSADVNEDSTIDIHDVVLLNQWLLAEGLEVASHEK